MSQAPSTFGTMITSSLSPIWVTSSVRSSSTHGLSRLFTRVQSAVSPRSAVRATSIRPCARGLLAIHRHGVLEVAEQDVGLPRDVGRLGGHLLVREVEEMDHPRGLEGDLAERLGGVDRERLEEVTWVSHRPVNLSFARCPTCSFSATTRSASASRAPLSVTPGGLRAPARSCSERAGYRGATFEEAVAGALRAEPWRSRSTTPTVGARARASRCSTGGLPGDRLRAHGLPGHARAAAGLGGHRAVARRRARARAAADVVGAAGWAGRGRLGDRLAHAHPPAPTTLDDDDAARGAGGVARGGRASASGGRARRSPIRTATTTSAWWRPRGAAGYAAAGTLPARLHPERALAWPRVGIYHGDDERRFRMKVSRAMRRLRGSRLWPG